jgi:hypothetical protein
MSSLAAGNETIPNFDKPNVSWGVSYRLSRSFHHVSIFKPIQIQPPEVSLVAGNCLNPGQRESQEHVPFYTTPVYELARAHPSVNKEQSEVFNTRPRDRGIRYLNICEYMQLWGRRGISTLRIFNSYLGSITNKITFTHNYISLDTKSRSAYSQYWDTIAKRRKKEETICFEASNNLYRETFTASRSSNRSRYRRLAGSVRNLH